MFVKQSASSRDHLTLWEGVTDDVPLTTVYVLKVRGYPSSPFEANVFRFPYQNTPDAMKAAEHCDGVRCIDAYNMDVVDTFLPLGINSGCTQNRTTRVVSIINLTASLTWAYMLPNCIFSKCELADVVWNCLSYVQGACSHTCCLHGSMCYDVKVENADACIGRHLNRQPLIDHA